MLALQDYDRFDLRWSFNPVTGAAQPGSDQRCHGFLHRFQDATGQHVAAAFSDGANLMFAVDDRSWNVAEVQLGHERRLPDRTCLFTVTVDGALAYSLTYRDPITELSAVELITLDGIDVDELDFFHWAADLGGRRDGSLAVWSAGFERHPRSSI